MAWGLPAPPGVTTSWGARAIYRAPDSLDLLWAHQEMRGEDTEAINALSRWLNKTGLRELRRHLKKHYLDSDEDREERLERGGYVIIANPRKSYGYLYLCAWRLPDVVRSEAVDPVA